MSKPRLGTFALVTCFAACSGMRAHGGRSVLFERYIGRTFHLSADRTFAREEDGGAFTLRRVGSGVAVFEDEGTRVFVPLERLAVRVLR